MEPNDLLTKIIIGFVVMIVCAFSLLSSSTIWMKIMILEHSCTHYV